MKASEFSNEMVKKIVFQCFMGQSKAKIAKHFGIKHYQVASVLRSLNVNARLNPINSLLSPYDEGSREYRLLLDRLEQLDLESLLAIGSYGIISEGTLKYEIKQNRYSGDESIFDYFINTVGAENSTFYGDD